MTKSFKGLSSRNFTATNNIDEVFAGREAIAALRAATLSPTEISLGLSSSLADDVIQLDDPVSEFVVLECLDSKAMMVRFLSNNGGGTLSASPTPGLEIGDEGAFGVPVGGSVSGVIDVDNDTDDITVFLVSGQTYLISLRGTGADPLSDSLLRLFAADGVTLVATDDDGGTGTNSLLTYTATATGQHVIRAASFNNNPDALNQDTGGYTVDVRVQGVDAVGFTNAMSVPLQLGTTFGFREFGTGSQSFNPVLDGDTDMYAVTLEAGHFYTFEVASGFDGEAQTPGINAMNPIIVLYDAAGFVVQRGTAQNDNLGSDLSSALGVTAITSGTYYLQVSHRVNQTGGYVIDFKDVDYSGLSPLDAIDWIDADVIDTFDIAGVPTAYVYFGAAGETFGETTNGVTPITTFGWNAIEKAAIMNALLEFTKITGIQYVETTIESQAEFRLNTVSAGNFGAYFYPQDEGFGTQQGIGIFNVNSGGWDKPGVSTQDIPGDQVSLEKGGFSFAVILHEFGHGHGLAHAHDTGGSSQIMPGVFTTSGNGTFSVFNMNQGVYTVMSYNDAWRFHPDGNSPFTIAGLDNGWSGTLSAFDIAVLQDRYGVHDNNTGDNAYVLTDVVDNAFYECIWDSGGTDAITYGGALNTFVDLTAATLDYSATGGGVMSFLDAGPGAQLLRGGYTIANGVVIENASTGSGNDQLVGNSAANDLSGNGGADTFRGQGGDDAIHGGSGSDTAFYAGPRADYTVGIVRTNGVITGYTVTDNNAANGNEGTDTLDGVESLSFAGPTSLALVGAVAVFDQNDNLVSVHSTIQAAIDAGTTLDGYRVVISGGAYAEDVNVTKDLTIEGANDGLDGSDAARVPETSVQSFVITASGVTIDGVEVYGSITYPGSSFPSGVYVIGNDFSLVNSVLDGAVADVGIVTQFTTGLDVGNNLITGYGAGAYVSGGASTGSFHDNRFQGDGTVSNLQNGILFESGYLVIETNVFDSIAGGSIFVLSFEPATLDLTTLIIDNTITNSGAARPVQIYPNGIVTTVNGTDFNEAFNGDLVAGPGPFTYNGNGGNDDAYGSALGDTFSGGDGADRLYGGAGDDTLSGDAGNDLLDGDVGIDTAEFADANLVYLDTAVGWVVTSSDGNDVLQNVEIAVDGTGQRNLLVGSTGFAGLQAAFDGAEDGDNVRLGTGTYSGTYNFEDDDLTVISQPGATINATFATTGTDGITVRAAGGIDNITGSANGDLLDGGAGNDTLAGGGGGDFLLGGAGADTMSGNTGDDTFYVDDAGDVVTEADGEGNDRIATVVSYALTDMSEVEVLEVNDLNSANDVNLTGNDLDNRITGNDGINILRGFGGNDVLSAGAGNDFLVGGDGTDTMTGDAGNDTFYVNDTADIVYEIVGQGNDRVAASASYTLASGQEVERVEAEDLTGTTAIDLTGNELANALLGNNGANTLDGKDGNDSLQGLDGADVFAFTSALGAGNVDTIVDFGFGDDTIALDDAVFAGIGTPGSFSANAFVVGTAALDADDRIIYNGNQLYYDADGNGAGAAVLFATVSGTPLLTAADFQVI